MYNNIHISMHPHESNESMPRSQVHCIRARAHVTYVMFSRFYGDHMHALGHELSKAVAGMLDHG
jgi:hypothetical protein